MTSTTRTKAGATVLALTGALALSGCGILDSLSGSGDDTVAETCEKFAALQKAQTDNSGADEDLARAYAEDFASLQAGASEAELRAALKAITPIPQAMGAFAEGELSAEEAGRTALSAAKDAKVRDGFAQIEKICAGQE